MPASKKHPAKSSSANVALCYIRRSMVRDQKDLVSPEIQRQNILRICDTFGFTPEWYEDIEGHRSGMHEQGRPGWLALKARLNDADVAALIANDLSRLHRKGWRIGDLLDFVDQRDIRLILADPNKQIDFSTPQGRVIAQLSAIFDEWYAVDVSIRRKANIAHRKSQNKTVGLPPFGTKRNQDGYLIPSEEGAWWLPDGTWVPGKTGDAPPVKSAVWRSYFACAQRILELYAQGYGRSKICIMLQAEGYAFRNRAGEPNSLEVHDIRRVTSNWIEYGGIVMDKKAITRKFTQPEIEEIALDPERAVFDIPLLKKVAMVACERTTAPPDVGRRQVARVYPLSGLLYCAHCEALSRENPGHQQTRLIGIKGRAYRHRQGLHCACTLRQVPRRVVEPQFARIVEHLSVEPEMLEHLTTIAIQFSPDSSSRQAIDVKKAAEIARLRRRLDAARHLYEDGDITREEYLRRRQQNEREIAQWSAVSTQTEQLSAELMICIEAVSKLANMWKRGTDEQKNGIARSIFESLTFDLDQQKIVDFRLKPWAEKFLVVRISADAHNEDKAQLKLTVSNMTPIGLEPITD